MLRQNTNDEYKSNNIHRQPNYIGHAAQQQYTHVQRRKKKENIGDGGKGMEDITLLG